MNSQANPPIFDQVSLLDGVKAVLENSNFDLRAITAEQNQMLVVPVDFLATSNGVRFVVKCISDPEKFDPTDLQTLVEFGKGHGITEVMIIGDGDFSPELVSAAAALSVRLTNREAYQQALAQVPPEVLATLGKPVPRPTVPPVQEVPLQNYAAKSAFEEPKKSGPPPLPMAAGVGHSDPPPIYGASAGVPGMQRMQSDLRDAIPAPLEKSKSAGSIVGRGFVVVLLLCVIWVGYSASKKGIAQWSDRIVSAADNPMVVPTVSVSKIIEDTILETRKTSGLATAPFDVELIKNLEPMTQVFAITGKFPNSKTLEEILGDTDPGFRVGSSAVFVADKPEELVTQVKSWSPLIDKPDDEFGSFSQRMTDGKVWTWVYHGNRIDRKQQLDEALKHGGNFVLRCGHCQRDSGFKLTAHAKFFVRPDCSHCGLTAHAFGPNTEGDYLRACDFLTGFTIPEEDVAQFLPENPAARTPKAEILAHWSAILERCDYEYDTRQKGASLRDVWKLPQQTWDERVGDCEDTSILLADALISAGYDARVALGHWEGGGHAWCVVKAEGRQWILETTQPLTGAASLRSIIKVGGDYVAMCTFNRDSIFLRRHAANLSTPDYFSDNYWLTLNLKEAEGE